MTEIVRRRIYFECGHRVNWPEDWNRRIAAGAARAQPQVEKMWRGQVPARGIGDSRMCPDCPGSRGRPQSVVGVINLPLRPERERGR